MTLDPGATQFLELAGGFALALDTDEQKKAFLDNLAPSRSGSGGLGGDLEPVAHIEDLTVPARTGDVTVRVYRPDGDRLPLVVFMHGGVFVLGGLEMHDAVLRRLANALPAVIVSVDYGLAPEQPFPAAVDDSYAALIWAADHAAELGADPDRVVVMGDSAGGGLAALMALRARDESRPTVALQVLLYPMVDPALETESAEAFAAGYLTTTSLLRLGWDLYLAGAEKERYASPAIAEDLTGLPPAIVVTAGYDPLRDEGLAYTERLQAAGTHVRHLHYPGQIHGFIFMPAVIAEGEPALAELFDAMREALHQPA